MKRASSDSDLTRLQQNEPIHFPISNIKPVSTRKFGSLSVTTEEMLQKNKKIMVEINTPQSESENAGGSINVVISENVVGDNAPRANEESSANTVQTVVSNVNVFRQIRAYLAIIRERTSGPITSADLNIIYADGISVVVSTGKFIVSLTVPVIKLVRRVNTDLWTEFIRLQNMRRRP